MLFGGSRGCRDDLDCESNVCLFGSCAGLITADELWRVERVATRVRERIALQPELSDLVVDLVADVATREEMGLAFRGRSVRALGRLLDPAGEGPEHAARARRIITHLQRLLVVSPGPVAEVAAIALATLGDPTGADIVIALTESEREATAIEALRVLGLVRGDAELRNEVLVTLLSTLSPELDIELQRAGIAGLAALGDARAIGPLADYLTVGSEPLAAEVAEALRQLSGHTLGGDPLAWDAWLDAHPPPAPPPYTPRGHDSMDDIDLPTP
jgi:hypothetical protein